jgi:hypothetical protein
MVTASSLRTSLVPLLLLAATSNYECQVNTAPGTGELHIFGTIRFISIEGGCWALDTSDGRRFELRSDQVPENLRRDGNRVAVIGLERDDWVSVCQVGNMLDVRQVTEAEQ